MQPLLKLKMFYAFDTSSFFSLLIFKMRKPNLLSIDLLVLAWWSSLIRFYHFNPAWFVSRCSHDGVIINSEFIKSRSATCLTTAVGFVTFNTEKSRVFPKSLRESVTGHRLQQRCANNLNSFQKSWNIWSGSRKKLPRAKFDFAYFIHASTEQ